LLACAFAALWGLLTLVDLVDLFGVEGLTADNERKFADAVIEYMTERHDEIDDDSLRAPLLAIKSRLCDAAGIADTAIRLHFIDDDDVNAFALPDDRVIVLAGLIEECRTPEELAGVLAHELAHIERRHVVKKLTKDIGVIMLTTIAAGDAGGEIMRETAAHISSTAFDREQESEADADAVRYMAAAGIDPESFANFLFRIAKEKDIPRSLVILSTHPHSTDRASKILQLKKEQSFEPRELMSGEEWRDYQMLVKGR
jgi:predicted Zn-dependent protease